MQGARGNAVRAVADGRPFSHRGGETTYSTRGGALFVTTAGRDGKVREFEVSHTFGDYPLQQYLVSFPDGRRQALGVAWDSRPREVGGQRWFHLFPEDGSVAGEPRHWASIDQNWNYQCADCHSTNLRKKYDPASDRFSTTWSEISVGCEACHGPGSNHLAWADRPDEERSKTDVAGLTARLDERRDVHWRRDGLVPRRSAARTTQREIEVCARCHARRGQFGDDHFAGQPFLDAYQPALLETGLYFVDGQQRDEVFTYGSFLQSRMNQAGVTCSDCHEPHSGKRRVEGNGLCTRCHAADHFDSPAHHHHREGQGSQCVACHMPAQTYMGVDPRRDHSFRIPRPDRSVTLGVPNACGDCHAEKGASWASEALRLWYPASDGGAQDFAERFRLAELERPDAVPGLVDIVSDQERSPWIRASALQRLASLHRSGAANSPALLEAVGAQLAATDDTLRWVAVSAMAGLPARERARRLAPRLSDKRRLIRIEAARTLAGEAEEWLPSAARPAFEAALRELLAAERFNADRPESHARLGDLHAARGQVGEAEAAYRQAIVIDRSFVPAWVNLARLLEGRDRLEEAVALLRRAVAGNAGSAEIQHAYGLALIRRGARSDALPYLKQAAALDPSSVRMVYVYLVAVHDISGRSSVLEPLRAALGHHPQSGVLNELGVVYLLEAGDAAGASQALARLAEINPRRAAQLAERLGVE